MSQQEDVYWKAANAISKAKFLLIATGAGFSACSGLPVYNDIANVPAYQRHNLTYHDLARPTLLDPQVPSDTSLFYGFWCKCMQQYKRTTPHAGYEILSRWSRALDKRLETEQADIHDKLMQKQKEFMKRKSNLAQSTFIYTSNVDAHFPRFFSGNCVYEIHGNVFEWQCSDVECANKNGCWTFDPDVLDSIAIDEESMTIRNERDISQFKCEHCGSLTRPNVLLFGDTTWKLHTEEENTYVSWECAVENCLKQLKSQSDGNKDYPFVVLEMGCGLRVPEVRLECENVVRDTFGSSVLIRINSVADHATHLDDKTLEPHTISITDTSLHALQMIDQFMQQEE